MLGPAASAFMAMILVCYPYGSCAAYLILVGEHCLPACLLLLPVLLLPLALPPPPAVRLAGCLLLWHPSRPPMLPLPSLLPPLLPPAAGDSFQPLLLEFFAPAWWNSRAAVISAVGCTCILPLCFRTRLGALRGGALAAGQAGKPERHAAPRSIAHAYLHTVCTPLAPAGAAIPTDACLPAALCQPLPAALPPAPREHLLQP